MSEWILITDEFLSNDTPEWFHKDMYISDGKALYVGKYEWQQGWHPDRLIIPDCANVSALGLYVQELKYPDLPIIN